MEFRIADTFTDSLARLTGEEQKLVKLTAFDLQKDPANPSMQFHRLDKSRDRNFWSARVSSDLRIIVHKTQSSFLLCYAEHHAKAYEWAERRKIETHPTTGAAQFVEIRETVKEVIVPKYVEVEQPLPPKPPLFSGISDDDLLKYGVPREWLADVRAANEDHLLEIATHLPGEAAEALINLATGETPPVPRRIPPGVNPFDHPDAQRRFRIMTDVFELERALEYPWDKWSIFLHPTQRELVDGDYDGPARVSGSAGTGKTIVALHRAVYLVRKNPNARVLFTTFSESLSNSLHGLLSRLISNEPRLGERVEVHTLDEIGRRLYELNIGKLNLVSTEELQRLIEIAAGKIEGIRFSLRFLRSEWEQVVDAWQLESWEAYRDVTRLGRKTRLPEKQRRIAWSIFELVRSELKSRGLLTVADMFSLLAVYFDSGKHPPFDHVVVDEAQDVSVAQLRFLAAMGAGRRNGLFFAGDLGQRIFQQAFSWKALGIDIRGRSRTLRVNYRISHQIRVHADRLLGPEVSDVDGNIEGRRGTVSVFNGPQPEVMVFASQEEEIESVAEWLVHLAKSGVEPHEIGVFVRSEAELNRSTLAVGKAGMEYRLLDERSKGASGFVSIGTMHLAKGLEFKGVAVMACDDQILPLQSRIETIGDEADLEEVYNTERQLFYVACTRARDHLLVTGVEPGSEYLDDLKVK